MRKKGSEMKSEGGAWLNFLVAVSHEISSAALCSCTMNVKLCKTELT